MMWILYFQPSSKKISSDFEVIWVKYDRNKKNVQIFFRDQ